MNWDRIIEQKIREAQAEGKFDNLSGKGRPLSLDENPFQDPAWQMANDLLKAQGFRPDWLEDDAMLREKLAQARAALARTRDWRAEQLAALAARGDPEAVRPRMWIASEWERAVERFREAVAQINAGIASLNLKVPLVRFQRRRLIVEDELRKLMET